MSKQWLLACLVFMVSLGSFAQSKKEVKKFHIKSVTEVDTENGKTINDGKTTFNKDGLVIEKVIYNKEGAIKVIYRYKYNANHDEIEEAIYTGLNLLKEKTTKTYNALGEKVEEWLYDGNLKLVKKYTYTYNRQGLKVERKTFDATGQMIAVRKYNYQF